MVAFGLPHARNEAVSRCLAQRRQDTCLSGEASDASTGVGLRPDALLSGFEDMNVGA